MYLYKPSKYSALVLSSVGTLSVLSYIPIGTLSGYSVLNSSTANRFWMISGALIRLHAECSTLISQPFLWSFHVFIITLNLLFVIYFLSFKYLLSSDTGAKLLLFSFLFSFLTIWFLFELILRHGRKKSCHCLSLLATLY